MKRSPGYHLRAMASASVRLFVYGSLKRNGRHHQELAGATFLGEAETSPGYRLEALGDYFALVPVLDPTELDVVRGELFEVPEAQLSALDEFEGDAYIRAPLELRRPPPRGDEPEESLAYFRKAR